MASTKVPPFSGTMNENGYDWLKDIELFFMEAQWTDDTQCCEYFRLCLQGNADRHLNTFDLATQWTWDLLHTKWIQTYPPPVPEEITSKTTELNIFKALRLDLSKLTEPVSDKEGALTWETIRFVKTLRYYRDKILSTSDESKGAEAYSHLPTIVRDKVTAHTGPSLGPKLTSLCTDLLKLDHHDITGSIKEHTKEKDDLQNQLNSIQANINRQPRPIPTNRHPPYAATITPAIYVSTAPNQNTLRLANAPPPPIPTTFSNSADGFCLHEEVMHAWDIQYGRSTLPALETKYPLTPGLLTPGSTATPSDVGACVGSGHIIKSLSSIPLRINIDGITVNITFKILNSQGAFEVLLGKLWLTTTSVRGRLQISAGTFPSGTIPRVKHPLEAIPHGIHPQHIRRLLWPESGRFGWRQWSSGGGYMCI
ncbi:hypothetical protein M422DRAFT_265875 [Sphaerobolus stellatus SS14]|uniref:Uncharacterized protein n=1 Tax=Sphaerobolus stellatus (strain SS14) TaxID=990650 RepID=A0A0C9UT18_SPHS4|nr:hypothetical protein M422DRAFT_265875 [Sphaerobolus stellatus SS14]